MQQNKNKSQRAAALIWWKKLGLLDKVEYTLQLGHVGKDRDPRSLTGREIETLYEYNVTKTYLKP